MDAHIFFGGFRQFEISQTQNVFSKWLKPNIHAAELFLNLIQADCETLDKRWVRFYDKHYASILAAENVYILGYSMGCHLAVKLAAQLNTAKTLKELCLIAPDPKFAMNAMDVGVSAYSQAQALWQTAECPGTSFCNTLKSIARFTDLKIPIVFSKVDLVAQWKGNVERLFTECTECVEQVEVTETDTKLYGSIAFRLSTIHARNEQWVHEQLFSLPVP